MKLGVALLVVAGMACARRMPPHATMADAQRGNLALRDLEEGRALVVAKCGSRCHQPPLPDDHTAAEWPRALDEMAPRAAITVEERHAIEQYLVVMTAKR